VAIEAMKAEEKMQDENQTTCPNCNRRDVEIRELRKTLCVAMEIVRKLGEAVQECERLLRSVGGDCKSLTIVRQRLFQANDALVELQTQSFFDGDLKDDNCNQ
jgi:hypothetical protein